MRVPNLSSHALALLFAAVVTVCSCGGSHDASLGDDGGGGDNGGGSFATGSSGGSPVSGDGGSAACPSGLQCNVSCSGTSTSISGKVYDPAGRNPLYNIVVYVPATPLVALPQGVPTGADACSCPALYKSGNVVLTTTAVDGTFKLNDAPVGSSVPLVIQVGKWRRLFHVNVTACQDNLQADKTLLLPKSVAAGDTDDSMPDIAVSTGSADTLECLMTRIGLPSTEYVAGAGGSRHVHVFSGGQTVAAGLAGLFGGGGGGGGGTAETPGMTGAPVSSTSLWSTQAQLMPYDVVLLSCEGGETYNANPPVLEQYLNVGGRVFASHYHYAWFSGPIGSGQTYSAPADWGTNLAAWTANGNTAGGGGGGGGGTKPIGGTIVTTLNGSTQAFAKGQALDTWLGDVNALGQNGVPAGELSIYQPRYNAQVTAPDKPSQPWITSSPWTMYFSFDTPVNPPAGKDEQAPAYCGRAVFSDLHVAGDPLNTDTSSPPGGCATGPLSPFLGEGPGVHALRPCRPASSPTASPPSTTGPGSPVDQGSERPWPPRVCRGAQEANGLRDVGRGRPSWTPRGSAIVLATRRTFP